VKQSVFNDDGIVAGTKAFQRPLAALNGLCERANRPSHLRDIVSAADADVDDPVIDLKLCRFCVERHNSRHIAHVHSPRSKTTERFESEADKLNGGNPVTSLTHVTPIPFLPTAFFFGRVEEQLRAVTAVTTPANDNSWPSEPRGAA
jgi:hypothetical protein